VLPAGAEWSAISVGSEIVICAAMDADWSVVGTAIGALPWFLADGAATGLADELQPTSITSPPTAALACN
jgi:hypothetical protein